MLAEHYHMAPCTWWAWRRRTTERHHTTCQWTSTTVYDKSRAWQ